MGHGHDHHFDTLRHERPLRWALALTLVFLVAEVVGAWLSNSLALLSDAAHMASDAFALGIALAAVRLSRCGMNATGIQASGTRNRRSTTRPSGSVSATVKPPYIAAATLSGWPSRRAASSSSSSASRERRPTAAPSTTPATMAAALDPRPRADGIMLDTSSRHDAAPGAADRRSP